MTGGGARSARAAGTKRPSPNGEGTRLRISKWRFESSWAHSCARLAQRLEQLFHTERAGGSSPPSRTVGIAQSVERGAVIPEVASSSLAVHPSVGGRAVMQLPVKQWLRHRWFDPIPTHFMPPWRSG